MNISVIGVGYVGLVTAACFAEMGNQVTCIDIDLNKITYLKNGIIPIYEPGLKELVERNLEAGRLYFTTEISDATKYANIHFIAVSTPPNEDGSADLKHVLNVATNLAQTMTASHHIVINKSTVPVGTGDHVRSIIESGFKQRNINATVDVVSNPEFLKEGNAINDFMRPSRIIVGSESDNAINTLKDLYFPFVRNHERTLVMGIRDAEMTKYASNAMLATKISFMNEISGLCDELDVDIENVRNGMGSDERIGYHFIYPGCGYGGSCFPKDVKALINMAKETDIRPHLLHAVESRNQQQKLRLFEKICSYYNKTLVGMRFALWGLAFKPGTDDMREAPSLEIIHALVNSGAEVIAYDPVASETARDVLPDIWLDTGKVTIAQDPYAILRDTHGLVICTEWKVFRSPDFHTMLTSMKNPVIFDGRNLYSPQQMQNMGFDYIAIGRKALQDKTMSSKLRRIA